MGQEANIPVATKAPLSSEAEMLLVTMLDNRVEALRKLLIHYSCEHEGLLKKMDVLDELSIANGLSGGYRKLMQQYINLLPPETEVEY